ncbi:MAG TPA: inositol monophosphatase family protein, partial [Candidatus Polarisedimenticolaceae bacterium]|nr:inositol monophosphatase family protein [Candidatus Polarisedimenticolaceae bacterium]
ATWTFEPKHEWDVAAGTALVAAAGGVVWTPDGAAPRFNQPAAKFPGLLAASAGSAPAIRDYLSEPA